MELIDTNIDSANFIGFVAGELYTKYCNRASGKPLTKGLVAMLSKFLNTPLNKDDTANWTEKDNKLFSSLEFKERERILALASDFIH